MFSGFNRRLCGSNSLSPESLLIPSSSFSFSPLNLSFPIHSAGITGGVDSNPMIISVSLFFFRPFVFDFFLLERLPFSPDFRRFLRGVLFEDDIKELFRTRASVLLFGRDSGLCASPRWLNPISRRPILESSIKSLSLPYKSVLFLPPPLLPCPAVGASPISPPSSSNNNCWQIRHLGSCTQPTW